jgi:hypothetical protein
MLDLVWGSQTQLLYSNFGRIKDVYAFSFTDFEFTFITTKKNPIHHKYVLHQHTLQTESSTKYLGVTIHSDLKCNKHIDNISFLVLLGCNCGHLSSVSMFVTELVLWNLLQMYLAALRWTISSLLMLDLVWGIYHLVAIYPTNLLVPSDSRTRQ